MQTDDRLVVNLLIDGQQPDLSEMKGLRKSLLQGKVLYIETAARVKWPSMFSTMCRNNSSKPSNTRFKPPSCFSKTSSPRPWKAGHLFHHLANRPGIRPQNQPVAPPRSRNSQGRLQSVAEILADFTAQLRQTKQTLIDRDFVSLTDQLLYETSTTCDRWIHVLDAIRTFANA